MIHLFRYVRMLIGPAMGFEALKCISYPAQACVLDPKINFAEVDSSDGFLESIDGIFSPHDMKRLEAYTNNLVDLQSEPGIVNFDDTKLYEETPNFHLFGSSCEIKKLIKEGKHKNFKLENHHIYSTISTSEVERGGVNLEEVEKPTTTRLPGLVIKGACCNGDCTIKVKNQLEENEVVGITNYTDFGFELQSSWV